MTNYNATVSNETVGLVNCNFLITIKPTVFSPFILMLQNLGLWHQASSSGGGNDYSEFGYCGSNPQVAAEIAVDILNTCVPKIAEHKWLGVRYEEEDGMRKVKASFQHPTLRHETIWSRPII